MFYSFGQNNSGGSFQSDKNGLTHWVIIEADCADEANSKAEDLGIYFNGCDNDRDCSCCGDRWYPVSKGDGTKKPEVYGKSPTVHIKTATCLWMKKGKEICVHYKNGKKKWF
jgi:hypothetical protein